MRTFGLHIGLVLAFSLPIAGCSIVVTQQDSQFVSERLPFIQDGRTSREEILDRMGEPANRYENGRILTYVLCVNGQQLHVEKGDSRDCRNKRLKENYSFSGNEIPRGAETYYVSSGTYHLVLVFGSSGLVEKHGMVLVE